MRLSFVLLVTLIVKGAANVLPSPKTGVTEGGQGALRGAGEAVTRLLMMSSSSPSHCSLILFTSSSSYSTTFLKEMTEFGAPWAVVVLEETSDGSNNTHLVRMARQVRRRSWCITVVVLSQDPTFLASFARKSRRGRLLVWTTKLVVVTASLGVQQLRGLMGSHWTFSMMSTLVIDLKDESSWDVYHWLPYTSAGPQMVLSTHSSPRTGLVSNYNNNTLFPDKFSNFHGASIPVSSLQLLPLFDVVEKKRPDGTTSMEYIGREYLMLLAVAKTLNFNPEIKRTSTVTEGVRTLLTGESALLFVRMMVLPQIVKVVDYSFYVDRATFTFAMAKPPTKPRWQGSYYPFTSFVWLATVATLFLLPLVLLVVMLIGGQMADGGARIASEAQKVIFEVFGVLLGQDLLRRVPQTTSVRSLVSAWIVFAFVMGACYRGNLTAFLTIPKYPERPETLDQLAEAKVHSKFVRNVTWFYDYFTKSPIRSSRSIGEKSSLVDRSWEGMLYISNTRGAFFYERFNIMLMIAENYTERNLYVAKENVLPNYSCWLLPPDAPYKDNLDKILSRIAEAGLKAKWLDDVMRDLMRGIRRRKRGGEEPQAVEVGGPIETQQPLALTHLQGPFYLLLLGFMISVCAFVREVLHLRLLSLGR